jgi:hypothetical protein
MYDPYEYDDDDEYEDDQYNYDYNDQYDPYKFYFKFDVGMNSPISDWLNNLFNNIDVNGYNIQNVSDFPVFQFPVNSWNPNAGQGNSYQYLGSNYASQPIWKKKYLVSDPINQQYKLHLQAHAKHFIQQPIYYNGMFDILN